MRVNKKQSRSIAVFLTASFLLVGIVPTVVISALSYIGSAGAIEQQSLAQLTSIRDVKKDMVQRYLSEREIHAAVLATNPVVTDGLMRFRQARESQGIGSPLWSEVEAEVAPFLNSYASQYGYRSFYLIDRDGTVLYNSAGDNDIGSNLLNGNLQDSNLADAVRRAAGRSGALLSDMAFYGPAGNSPLMFVVHPIREGQNTLGYVALAIPPAELEAIMAQRSGLGDTGETFLVGSDLVMRTSLFLLKEDTALRFNIDAEPSRRARAGETGAIPSVDYRREPIFAAFTPLEYGDLGWLLIAKIDQAEALAANRMLLVRAAIVVAVAAVAIVMVALWISRGIAVPVKQVADAARQMADGNLTVGRLKIDRKDEIGEMAGAFARMSDNLRDVMEQIRRTIATLLDSSQKLLAVAEESSSATGQIAAAVNQVAQGTSNQVSQVEETRAAMDQLRRAIDQIAAGAQEQAQQAEQTTRSLEDMARAVEQVSASAKQVADAADRGSDRARSGGEAVTHVAQGMAQIRSSVTQVAERIDELGQYSRQIGQIVDMISDIAEQTNLLALNAAIEAARAGEHGRGFGVVAEEVRQLAERSAKSTREIGHLIGSIQAAVDAAISDMRDATKQVETGTDLASNARAALDEIIEAIGSTDELAHTISEAAEQMAAANPEMLAAMADMASVTEENTAATEEMAASSDQVVRSMAEVAKISEETASGTEEVSASTEELNAAAEDMKSSVQTLTEIASNLEQLVQRFRL